MAERSASPPQAAENRDNAAVAPATEVDFSSLIVTHHAALYRYAYRLCGCSAEAEDLTQQAFLLAQQRLHQLREVERAAAWLFAILRTCFLKSLRKRRPLAAARLDLSIDEVPEQTPEVESLDHEQLRAALDELPDEFRIVVLMFYFEDLSYQEIATALDVPPGTVMSRLSRAKAYLRKRLTPELSPVPHPRNGSARPAAARTAR